MVVIALWGSIVTIGYTAWRRVDWGAIGRYANYDANWNPSPSIIICLGNFGHSCKKTSSNECKGKEAFGLFHFYLQWLLGSCSGCCRDCMVGVILELRSIRR